MAKDDQEEAKVRDTPARTKHQANSHNIHAEDMVQTHIGNMLAASVSKSPSESSTVD